MKRSFKLLVLLMVFAINGTSLFAQQSDYQIKKDFENRHAELLTNIEMAQKVNEIDSLIMVIDDFRSNFSDHSEMLDYALYPESFDSKIANLKSEARSSEHKLLIIENQAERLSELTEEVTRFKSELSSLNSRSDSLRNAITESQESEKKLSQLLPDTVKV